jgi:hypothetical protein
MRTERPQKYRDMISGNLLSFPYGNHCNPPQWPHEENSRSSDAAHGGRCGGLPPDML